MTDHLIGSFPELWRLLNLTVFQVYWQKTSPIQTLHPGAGFWLETTSRFESQKGFKELCCSKKTDSPIPLQRYPVSSSGIVGFWIHWKNHLPECRMGLPGASGDRISKIVCKNAIAKKRCLKFHESWGKRTFRILSSNFSQPGSLWKWSLHWHVLQTFLPSLRWGDFRSLEWT